ncbi:hypothetical protein B0H13DRAFT_1861452 [Mycena leptocephala]|nr:hypothetical protein B0H13DRAFT_1861452 [Mycena leptocephala]
MPQHTCCSLLSLLQQTKSIDGLNLPIFASLNQEISQSQHNQFNKPLQVQGQTVPLAVPFRARPVAPDKPFTVENQKSAHRGCDNSNNSAVLHFDGANAGLPDNVDFGTTGVHPGWRMNEYDDIDMQALQPFVESITAKPRVPEHFPRHEPYLRQYKRHPRFRETGFGSPHPTLE